MPKLLEIPRDPLLTVELKFLNKKNLISYYIFCILFYNTVKSMGDFREKKIPSGFPTLSQITRSGVPTICDLVEAVPSIGANKV